jgi:antitoxin PrlF
VPNLLAEVMSVHDLLFMKMVLEAQANLTAQNQITIPAPIRKVLKLQGGQSRVRFQVRAEDGRVVILLMEATKEAEDPALKPFLALLEKDVRLHPHRISPFPASLRDRARSLVDRVEVNLDGPLAGKTRLVLAWVNDEETLRTYGSKTDAYAVFESMLRNNRPPDERKAFLKEAGGTASESKKILDRGRKSK